MQQSCILLMAQKKMNLDRIAIVAALLCALHCAAFPILLIFGVNGSLGVIDHWMIDTAFILFGLVFIYFSVVRSYFKHKKKTPLILSFVGAIMFLVAVQFSGSGVHILFALGGILWATAHYLNLRILQYSNT